MAYSCRGLPLGLVPHGRPGPDDHAGTFATMAPHVREDDFSRSVVLIGVSLRFFPKALDSPALFDASGVMGCPGSEACVWPAWRLMTRLNVRRSRAVG
jgi:hypothetical protein